MVVDHAGRLHEGVRRGRADEPEAAPAAAPWPSPCDSGVTAGTSRSRPRGGSRARGANDHSSSVSPPSRSTHPRGVGDGRLDLRPVADDARRRPSSRATSALVVRRDHGRVEAGERAPERLALAQDRDPREPGLERLEGQPLVEQPVAADRPAPLLVVVGDVVGRRQRPRAARAARRSPTTVTARRAPVVARRALLELLHEPFEQRVDLGHAVAAERRREPDPLEVPGGRAARPPGPGRRGGRRRPRACSPPRPVATTATTPMTATTRDREEPGHGPIVPRRAASGVDHHRHRLGRVVGDRDQVEVGRADRCPPRARSRGASRRARDQ